MPARRLALALVVSASCAQPQTATDGTGGAAGTGGMSAIGDGGATAFDGTPLSVGDRVVPAPNRACGQCEYCLGDFPYYFCRELENYGNSLTSATAPHLFGGWSEHLYLLPGTPVFKVPADLPTEVARRRTSAALTSLPLPIQ